MREKKIIQTNSTIYFPSKFEYDTYMMVLNWYHIKKIIMSSTWFSFKVISVNFFFNFHEKYCKNFLKNQTVIHIIFGWFMKKQLFYDKIHQNISTVTCFTLFAIRVLGYWSGSKCIWTVHLFKLYKLIYVDSFK